jgi:ribosomal protein L11 methyltransferase
VAARRIGSHLRSIDPPSPIRQESVPEIDWVAHSLKGLQPVQAGRFLVHGTHDRHRLLPHQIGIEIEASQAFGTGHHGTTAGCLEMLVTVVRREAPANVLDLGTGTAVLAIAVAKLSRIRVLATDIDPVATAVARENVRLNGAAGYVTTATATGLDHAMVRASAPFDLVIANILARPLMFLAPQMARTVAANGSVILSGILQRQRRSVIAAYRNQGFRHVRTLQRDAWVTIHMKR